MATSDFLEIVMSGSRVLRVPKRFGRYEYVKTLGTGSSSAVVLVRHSVTSNLFACKIVSRAHLIDENIFDRFEQEVRLLPSLLHPNIVHFEEIVFHPELIFLVMEYCSQGDLFGHIVSSGVFPESRARDILQQIGEAIRYLHDKDIAHRDIKPENILLDRHFIVKVADFGFCHVSASKALLKTPCGSPFYAPPEIISNESYDGKSADVWSLGVLLFTMVTGSLPWSPGNQTELFRQIRDADIDIPATLSAPLRELLGQMLERTPRERITIGEVLGHPWFAPIQKNWRLAGCIRSGSWRIVPDQRREQQKTAIPSGPKRLVVKPRRKAAASSTLPVIEITQSVLGKAVPGARKPSIIPSSTWS
jgi:5'-AMP-activated protein kinase catalytic alpha subunit